MGGFYMAYLESLCRRRGWRDPLYETYRNSLGFTCLVLVNGREYQTDLAHESDSLAQENAAMRAFMVCRNFSAQGGMLARNGVVQGLPANENTAGGRHRRSRGGRSHTINMSSSSTTTSEDSENSISSSCSSNCSYTSTSTTLSSPDSIVTSQVEVLPSLAESQDPRPVPVEADRPAAFSSERGGDLTELAQPHTTQKVVQSSKIEERKLESSRGSVFPFRKKPHMAKGDDLERITAQEDGIKDQSGEQTSKDISNCTDLKETSTFIDTEGKAEGRALRDESCRSTDEPRRFSKTCLDSTHKEQEVRAAEQTHLRVSNAEIPFTLMSHISHIPAVDLIAGIPHTFVADSVRENDDCVSSLSSHFLREHIDQTSIKRENYLGEPRDVVDPEIQIGDVMGEVKETEAECQASKAQQPLVQHLVNETSRAHGLDANDASESSSDRQSSDSEMNNSESDESSKCSVYRRCCGVINNRDEEQENFASPILDPIRRALVDRVMEEFWVIFSQIIPTDPSSCEEITLGPLVDGDQDSDNSNNASTTSSSSASIIHQSTSTVQHKRRLREEQEEYNDGDQKKQGPSKRRPLPSAGVKDNRFACPFRKHDPRSYTIHSHRSCALSCWATIARIKEHLYRCHQKDPHCQRCWLVFKTQQQLDSHMTVSAAEICEVKLGQPPDGLTVENERKLRSRKKTQPNQSDEETWRDVYRILFPKEDVPSPYFEPIQDDVPLSPEIRELADYEDYIRRELPSLVRHNIEEAVRREMQPLEASLIATLVDIVRDCQETVSRAYRQGSESVRSAQSSSVILPDVPGESTHRESTASHDRGPAFQYQHTTGFLDAIAEAPPPQQWEQLGLSMSELESHRSPDRPADDSGYGGSLKNCDCGVTCCCQTTQESMHGNSVVLTTPVPVNTEEEDESLRWTSFSTPDFLTFANPDYDWTGMNG